MTKNNIGTKSHLWNTEYKLTVQYCGCATRGLLKTIGNKYNLMKSVV